MKLFMQIVLVSLVLSPSALSAATFFVLNTNVTGPGSLQQAIFDANTNAGADRISFNIPSGGLTISPTNALPIIIEPVTIEGRTQPGFLSAPIIELNGAGAGAAVDGLKINTSNCVISALVINRFLGDQIEITNGANNTIEGCYLGLNLTGLTDASTGLNGILLINSANNVIGGLFTTNRNYISGNNQSGIHLGGASSTNNSVLGNYIGLNVTNGPVANSADGVRVNAPLNLVGGSASGARNIISGNTGQGIEITILGVGTVIRGNYIGTENTGTLDRGNTIDGILANAGGVIIGGGNVGEGNLISGNTGDGIELNGVSATNNLVLGNRIGTMADGASGLPNNGNGVLITTSSRNNIIGGVLAGLANVIAFNVADGISVAAAVANTNNTFRGNSIFSNGNLGIDLGTSGITGNDTGDADTGANQLQNFPVLSAATNTPGGTIIVGALNSQASTTYVIDFYSNVQPNPLGSGEGQTYLGSTNVTTDGSGNSSFSVSLPVVTLVGRYITATATDPFGNTSEFATNVLAVSTVAGQMFTVVNTNDSGAGSLRQAIIDANAAITAGDTIVFAITNPTTTIVPASALPTIFDPVTINGYTQPGAVMNTSPNAFNGVVPVRISGASAGSGVNGLLITAGSSTVRGLMITGFLGSTGDGIELSGFGGNIMEGCVIGLDSSGLDQGNVGNGVFINGCSNNIIGGTTLAARNVISGNNSDGIEINGVIAVNNQVVNNLIGLDQTGTVRQGNTGEGVFITGASGNLIGGTTAAARNVISANSDGINITAVGASNNIVQGNFIGLDVTGTVALGNSADGVSISSAPNTTLGGATAGAANIISGNSSDGVAISSTTATGNLVQGNRIGTDVTGTLDLGNTANGVFISSAPGNTIGGGTAAAGNLISGNNSDGIEITGVASLANVIQNNRIGLDAAGNGDIGNNGHGIFVTSSAHDNVIGGSGNTVAFSGLDGIRVATGTNNALRQNLIFNNSGLGINLGTDGVTTNDLNDLDVGANQLQNFPILSAATNTPTQVTIAGSLNSAASTTYAVDLFASVTADVSGHGEGQLYLGSTNVTTDGGGNASFLVSHPGALTGRYITATATDPFGNTSEFSPWLAAASTIAPTNLIVTTTNDSGAGSLREAIQIANSFISAGNDTISFAIPGAGVRTINVSNALPALSDAVTINGYSQTSASANSLCDGNNAVIRVELAGGFAPANTDGLTLSGVGNSIVRGLAIRGFPGNGVLINSGTNHQVAGCIVGLDAGGSATNRGNTNNGVYIIGPATSANRIGGESAADRNVISSNSSSGITIESSARNLIAGNFIGTDASGTQDRGNQFSGVLVYLPGSVSNVIGGVTGCSRNVISGNGAITSADHYGIHLYNAVGTRVLGNYIGLDVTGTQSLGNGSSGVRLRGASFNSIGDGTIAGRNIVSGNYHGVELELSSPTNVIVGNYIGTDVTGALDRGNSLYGVSLVSGGYNLVLSNVISGNNSDGVNSSSPGNQILANRIGVSAVSNNALTNLGSGIYIGQSNTQVGGTNANEGNLIAYNGGRGIMIQFSAVNCPILGNSIYSNNSLGIDLNNDASANPNDLGDGDNGANALQNHPVFTHALRFPTETVASGTFNSRTNASFRLEFFANSSADANGFGEGQTYLGFLNVTTDGNGNAGFTFTHPAALPLDNYFTATATDANNNTSEFSRARRIVPFDSVDLNVSIADSADPTPHATNYFYTVTVTNAGPTNATSIFVTNTLPPTVSYVNATPSQGSTSHAAGIVTWNVGNLNENGVATLTLTVASAGVTGRVTNNATVITARFDNTLSNNVAGQSTVLGIADLGVRIADAPDPVVAGQTLTFTATATNAGPDAATGATMNFGASSLFVITGSSISQGTFSRSGNSFAATLGTVPAGGTVTLTVTAIPVAEGSNNVHSASVSRLEVDPVSSNNSTNSFTIVNPGSGVIEFTSSNPSINEGAGTAAIGVQRLGGSIGTVTVNYATSNLTAVAGSDYTSTTGTLTFTNGETLKSILVPITDDAAAECNEDFTAHLFSPTGGTITLRTTNTTVTIFDNEVSASGTILALSRRDTNLPLLGGNNESRWPSVSADGRYVTFTSDASNLSADGAFFSFSSQVLVRDLITQTTTMASQGHVDVVSGSGSDQSLISGNGRYVLFRSTYNLTTNDTVGWQDVYLRDLVTETTTLISRDAAGTGSGLGQSFTGEPHRSLISSNGQSIVYTSEASNLTGVVDANLGLDVIFHDRVAGTNRLISVNVAGTAAGNGTSDDPVVSANGQVIAFISTATDLVTLSDANANYDVFIQDLATGANELISVNIAGTGAANGYSLEPYLNANGRYVVFHSTASNLATNDTNTRLDVFWRDRVAGLNVVASVNTNGVAGNGSSTVRGISADGRYVVFSSTSSDLVSGDNNATEDVFVRDMVSNVTVMVSRNVAGTGPGNNYSRYAAISGDGTRVAFESAATDLTAAGNPVGNNQVFVRNLVGNTTRLVSFRPGSANGANAYSYQAAVSFNGNVTAFTSTAEPGSGSDTDIWAHYYTANTNALVSEALPSATGDSFSSAPQINASGTHVVFASSAKNLTPGDSNQISDVFLFNLTNGVLTLISANTNGMGSGNDASTAPVLSANGRYVAFQSTASDLVAGDTNNAYDVFRRDTLSGFTALVSVNRTGSGPGNNSSASPEITPDGRFIVFETIATNLVANDLNGAIQDVVLRDMASNVVELISINVGGTGTANNFSQDPVISDDARFVAFQSLAGDLAPGDGNGLYDIYVRDRQTGTNLLCSRNLTGTDGGNQSSSTAVISGNGLIVLFSSAATNLVAGDTNGTTDIFAFNTTTRTLQLVSGAPGGSAANGSAFNYSISADGRYVAFQSSATNLVSNDSNGATDIFLRDLVSGTTTLISRNCTSGASGSGSSTSPTISADGRYITFESTARNLVGGDITMGDSNIYRYDRLTGLMVLISQNRFITGGGNDTSYQAVISANGGAIAFGSYADNLVVNDANKTTDIFAWQGNIVASGVDLVFKKTASTNTIPQSGSFSYALTVTNIGSAGATGVSVTDPLPLGVSFVSATSTQGTVTNSGGTVSATVGSLGVNAGARITINVIASSAGSVSNYSSASAIESDATPANNSAFALVTVTSSSPPTLAIQRTNSTQLFVSWPSSTPAEFLLETTTNLAPAIVWSAVTNSVSDNGTIKFVIFNVNVAEPRRYYRLNQ